MRLERHRERHREPHRERHRGPTCSGASGCGTAAARLAWALRTGNREAAGSDAAAAAAAMAGTGRAPPPLGLAAIPARAFKPRPPRAPIGRRLRQSPHAARGAGQ